MNEKEKPPVEIKYIPLITEGSRTAQAEQQPDEEQRLRVLRGVEGYLKQGLVDDLVFGGQLDNLSPQQIADLVTKALKSIAETTTFSDSIANQVLSNRSGK